MKSQNLQRIFILLFLLTFLHTSFAGLFDDRYPNARTTAMGGAGVAVAMMYGLPIIILPVYLRWKIFMRQLPI